MLLCDVLNGRRKEKKISYEELSGLTQISDSTLKKIFTGVSSDPGFETVRAIANALDISLDVIAMKTSGQSLTFGAIDMAKRISNLDAHGQAVVSAVLDLETERCAATERDFDALYARQREEITEMNTDSSTVQNMG